MKQIKNIISAVITLLCAAMVVANWRTPECTAWLIALVGWLEVCVQQDQQRFNA